MNTASDHLTRERTPGAATIMRAGLFLLIIVCGLALRRFGPVLGLPFFFVKYGGSVLWGTMVFFLVAMAAPTRSPSAIALISATVAICVELFRLVHTPMARRFPTDDFGRAADRPRVLAMEHARLWRRNRFGNVARSPCDISLRKSKALGAGHPSLRELKPLEPVQLFLDAALQILARAPRRGVDPAPFLHQQFAALAVGLQIDGGDDVFAHQNR